MCIPHGAYVYDYGVCWAVHSNNKPNLYTHLLHAYRYVYIYIYTYGLYTVTAYSLGCNFNCITKSPLSANVRSFTFLIKHYSGLVVSIWIIPQIALDMSQHHMHSVQTKKMVWIILDPLYTSTVDESSRQWCKGIAQISFWNNGNKCGISPSVMDGSKPMNRVSQPWPYRGPDHGRSTNRRKGWRLCGWPPGHTLDKIGSFKWSIRNWVL